MKNFISIAFIALAIIAMLAFWGCSNSTDPPQNTGPTEEQLDQLEDIQQTQLEYYTELEILLEEMDTASAKDIIVEIMSSDASIEWASVTSQGINIQYKGGFRGTLLLDPKRSSGSLRRGKAKNGNIARSNTGTGSVCPKSKSTIFLAAFYNQFTYYDDQVIDAANAVFTQAGYDSFEVYKDAECVFGWFNTIGLLDDYGIIRISSHGTVWPSDADIQNVYLWTGEAVNRTTNRIIYDHLADGFAHIGTIDSVTYYSIEGGFFAAANNFTSKKPFVSLAFCYSALGNWPLHIINCGASAVIGYSWSIFDSTEAEWMQDFFEQMCDTAREEPLTIGEWDISDDRLYYDTTYGGHWVALLYSGPDSMTLWEPFRITSIEPTSGMEDSIITIRGIGFGDTEGEVRFDYVIATDISVWTDTLIRVAVPTGLTAGVVIVKVVVEGMETNGVNFTIGGILHNIISIDPTSGMEGMIVTITGTGFGDTEDEVRFNDVAAPINEWSDTEIKVAVPAGFSNDDYVSVKVVVDGAESNGLGFTIREYTRGNAWFACDFTYIEEDDWTGDDWRVFGNHIDYPATGSFSGNTFYSNCRIDLEEGYIDLELTVIVDFVTLEVTSFEFSRTSVAYEGGGRHEAFSGFNIPMVIDPLDPNMTFVINGTDACSHVSNCEYRDDYTWPLGEWRELTNYFCVSGGCHLRIMFRE